MRTPIGLWSLILLYTLMSLGGKIQSSTVQLSNCLDSCYAADTNEVDNGQISLRFKLGSTGVSLKAPYVSTVLRTSQFPTYVTQIPFFFLTTRTSFQFAQESFRPPILSLA